MARGGASLIRIMIEAVDTATKLTNIATYGGNRGLSVKTPQRRMNSSHLKGATRAQDTVLDMEKSKPA